MVAQQYQVLFNYAIITYSKAVALKCTVAKITSYVKSCLLKCFVVYLL